MGAPDLPLKQTPPSILTPSRAVNSGAPEKLSDETRPFHRRLPTLLGAAAISGGRR